MSPERDPTRDRLLEAATILFAEHGFDATTTPEICRLADANDASVSYHFTDKLGIYKNVLGTAARSLSNRWATGLPSELAGEICLRLFIRQMMAYSSDATDLHVRIVMNELTAATEARAVLASLMRSRLKQLSRIIASLNGCSAKARLTRMTAYSIFAQVTLLYTARPALQLLWQEPGEDASISDRLAQHVEDFCLKAVLCLPTAA